MLKKQYHTERLTLVLSEPSLAGRVLAFHRRNREFFGPVEPLREKPYYTEEFQRRALARDLRNARELSALRLWLLPRDAAAEGEIMGVCSLGNIIFAHFRSAFFGYKLDAGHTGQGYMAEAAAALIRIAFDDLGLHRLECNLMPRNTRSLSLARRLGFEEEGLAKRYLNIGGVWEDHLHMVLLNEPED